MNHGVIVGVKSTDWVAGAIKHEVRNSSGDWRPYLVRGEKQWFRNVDSMGCVSFATNNSAEMQVKQQTGLEVNFSDRFLAKISGTTTQGNWVYIVLDTWRKTGVVNEEEWPAPPEPFGWSDYYVEIPQFVKDRAYSQSLVKYDLQYEYIPDHTTIAHHLKHAPLLITIPGHEVVGLSIDGNTLTYFDSYDPYIKTTPVSNVTAIYKAVLTAKGNDLKLVNDSGTYFLVGEKGKMGIVDIDSLAMLKELTDKEEAGSTAGIPQVRIIEKGFTIS